MSIATTSDEAASEGLAAAASGTALTPNDTQDAQSAASICASPAVSDRMMASHRSEVRSDADTRVSAAKVSASSGVCAPSGRCSARSNGSSILTQSSAAVASEDACSNALISSAASSREGRVWLRPAPRPPRPKPSLVRRAGVTGSSTVRRVSLCCGSRTRRRETAARSSRREAPAAGRPAGISGERAAAAAAAVTRAGGAVRSLSFGTVDGGNAATSARSLSRAYTRRWGAAAGASRSASSGVSSV